MPSPPTLLRIKRKIGQDPLQALILADRQGAKRSKPSSPVYSGRVTPVEEPASFYFQLTRTDDKLEDGAAISILSEAASKKEERSFVLPRQTSEKDTLISNELSDMVKNVVLDNATTSGVRKKRGAAARVAEPPKPTEESEYVYDVYQLATMTSGNHPKSQIGYIKFFTDSDSEFVNSDDDIREGGWSDNEDSNAEDYYQNDYPEDEDDNIENDIHRSDYDQEELQEEHVEELYSYFAADGTLDLVDQNYASADDDDYMFEEQEDIEADDFDEDDPEFLEFKKFQRVDYSKIPIGENDGYVSAEDADYFQSEGEDASDNEANYSDLVDETW